MGIKIPLIFGGIFFMVLGLALLVYQGGQSMQEAFFFIIVGIGFFIALDWHNARQPKRHLRIEEADPTQVVYENESPQEEIFEPSGSGGAGGAGGGVRMNHLEQAEALLQKIIDSPTDASVGPMVEKGLKEVAAMGYSEKGVAAFLSKLGSSLGGMNAQQFNEQAMKNRSVALATLAKLPKQPAS